MNAYHNIVNKMQSDEFEGKVSQVYVDEINNKVVVETTDLSIREKIENAVLDAGCINIQKSKGKAVATKTYLKPVDILALKRNMICIHSHLTTLLDGEDGALITPGIKQKV